MDLAHRTTLDLWMYYSSELKSTSFSNPTSVDAYTSLNMRLAWRPSNNVQLALVGNNLNKAHHCEFIGEHFLPASEIERSVYASIRVDF
jgi:iron complex outermembrane receptor protein